MNTTVIYNYLDYRAFINDMLKFKKQKNHNFSLRFLANKAGFNSHNFISLVVKGKRNLTKDSVFKLAKGLSLNKQESEFFENLVFMNQASTHEEKNHYYKKMVSVKGYVNIHKIEKASYDYFSKWYYPVISEIVTLGDRKFTPKQIAETLSPRITPKETEKALNVLMELNLIKKTEEGLWEKCNQAVTTGLEVKSLIITNFHKEMLKLANESIERHSPEERDISGVVLKVNKDAMKEIKEKIDTFRNEIAGMELNIKDPDKIVYLNIQAFPLTNSIESNEE